MLPRGPAEVTGREKVEFNSFSLIEYDWLDGSELLASLDKRLL